MAENQDKNLALKIRQARLLQNRSQAEVAQKSGCSQGAISRVETGDFRAVSEEILQDICRLLGVSWEQMKAVEAKTLICTTAGCLQNPPFDLNGKICFLPLPVSSGEFCPGCGGKLVAECPHCQVPVKAKAAFCGSCAKPLIIVPRELLSHPDPQAYLQGFDGQCERVRRGPPF